MMSEDDRANFSWPPEDKEDLKEWQERIALGEKPGDVYCRCCGDGSDKLFMCDGPGCCRSFCGGPKSCLAWYLPRGEVPDCEEWLCPYCESGDRIAARGSRFVRNVQWLQSHQRESRKRHLEAYWPGYVHDDALVCGHVCTTVNKGAAPGGTWMDRINVLCIFQDMLYVEFAMPRNPSCTFTETLLRTQVRRMSSPLVSPLHSHTTFTICLALHRFSIYVSVTLRQRGPQELN